MNWQMVYPPKLEPALKRVARRLNGQLRNRQDGFALEISKRNRWKAIAILGEPLREAQDTRTHPSP